MTETNTIVTITDTNHGLWTLTWHIGKSINITAGRIDKAVYGDTVRQVVQPHKDTPLEFIKDLGLGALAMICMIAFIWTWANRYDRVKERFFR